MIFQKMGGLAEYVQFLRETPAEAEALYQDIHYALKPTGCLWLGGSETIGG